MIDRQYLEKAIKSGCYKRDLLLHEPAKYFLRAIMAGMALTIICFLYWCLVQNLASSPFGKVLASLFFGVGLTVIVFINLELFTSNNMYMTVSSVEGKTSWSQAILVWIACWLGNLVGAFVIAILLYLAGSLGDLPANHALYTGALHKVQMGAGAIFFKGIMANWIVCLAVRVNLKCNEDMTKLAVLLLIVFVFLYLGFEHSIANMGTFAISLLGNGQVSVPQVAYNLVFSTLGNVVGGAVFVGLPFAYLNREPASKAGTQNQNVGGHSVGHA